MKAYKLNAETLTTLEDVVAVIDALGLQTTDQSPVFEAISKYFNIEVEIPAAPEGEAVPD